MMQDAKEWLEQNKDLTLIAEYKGKVEEGNPGRKGAVLVEDSDGKYIAYITKSWAGGYSSSGCIYANTFEELVKKLEEDYEPLAKYKARVELLSQMKHIYYGPTDFESKLESAIAKSCGFDVEDYTKNTILHFPKSVKLAQNVCLLIEDEIKKYLKASNLTFSIKDELGENVPVEELIDCAFYGAFRDTDRPKLNK